MEQSDIFFFTQLPPEIQCEILSRNIDMKTLFAIRSISNFYRDLTSSCVKHLSPETNTTEKIISLDPELILLFPNLISVAGEYPIIIKTLDQLIALSQHPHLRFAAFDITNLVPERYLRENEEEREILIEEEGPFWSLRYFFPEKEINCKNCLNEERFSYIFYYDADKYELSVDIYENGVDVLWGESEVYDYMPKLLSILSTRLNICFYNGLLSPDINEKLIKLPCLRQVKIGPNFYRDNIKTGILPLLRENIKILVKKGDIKSFGVSNYIDYVDAFLFQHDQIEDKVTSFLPFSPFQLDRVEEIFPNLKEISFVIEDEEILPEELDKYQKINVIKFIPED